MAASNWQPFERNSLRGFFDLWLASGLLLHRCSYHRHRDKRRVALPGCPQLDPDGRQRIDPATGRKLYSAVASIPDRSTREAFQAQALAAVDRMLAQGEL
jgi:hypothetical protein